MSVIIKLSNLRIISRFFVTFHELDISVIVFWFFYNIFLSLSQDSKEKSSGIMNSSVPVIRTFMLPFVITKAFPNAKFSSCFFLSLSTYCFAHSRKNGKNLVMLIYVLFF